MTDFYKSTAEKWTSDVKKDLVKSYTDAKRKASGKWERELQSFYEQKGTQIKVRIVGAQHTYWMVKGRKSNRDQSPEAIRRFVGWAGSTFLAKWVQDKQVSVNPFALAYKIAKQGIKLSETQSGFISRVLTDERIKQLATELGKGFLNEIQIEIKNVFK